jgi:predicted RNase H-like nuclease
MRVYGLDFTSAPRRAKPITCAACDFDGDRLHLDSLDAFADFAAFEAFLQRPGPWIAGFDFPFGQPARLIDNLDWGETWADYVGRIGRMSKAQFVGVITDYCATRPSGDKHHLRCTDILTESRSPMMLYGVPVGRMFFQGAPRLLASGVSVIPCHRTRSDRMAVEAYPALVARRWIGKRGYKTDNPHKQTPDKATARQEVVDGLRSECRDPYSFALDLTGDQADACVGDASGDTLDAVLCAVQAAWASNQPEYGVPPGCDLREGWIVDPSIQTPGTK